MTTAITWSTGDSTATWAKRTAAPMTKASTAARSTMPITVPSGTCTKTSMRIIRETGMITTGGVATTVAGGTVGGETNPRVLTSPASANDALCLWRPILWRLVLGWNDGHAKARRQP